LTAATNTVQGVGRHAEGDDRALRAATAPVEVESVDQLDRLEALAGELDDLLARSGAPATARWPTVRAELAHDPQARPRAVVVRRDGSAVATALLTAHLRNGAWIVHGANPPDAQGWLAALDDEAAPALARALGEMLQSLHRPWMLELRMLPADDATVAALHSDLPCSVVADGAEVAKLACDGSTTLSTCLSRNTRNAVTRAQKRIAAAGLQPLLEWTREPQVIERQLNEVVTLHRRRNHQLRGFAGLDDPRQRELFKDTVRLQAAAGRARLLTLRLEGQLAAFALCFESGKQLLVYSNMASPDWLGYSPGTIANAEVVAAAHRDPSVREVDWGPGLQRYKLSGGTVRVERLVHFTAWSSSSFRLAWSIFDLVRR